MKKYAVKMQKGSSSHEQVIIAKDKAEAEKKAKRLYGIGAVVIGAKLVYEVINGKWVKK